MKSYSILEGYFDKQMSIIKKLYTEIVRVNVENYEPRFLFAIRTQQFYTSLEDLFKQIAKTFENHIDNMSDFPKEILTRMNTEVPKIRPAVLSTQSLKLLDKIRAFRHFIRHAYDCELDEKELRLIQKKLIDEFHHVEKDLQNFYAYVKTLAGP